MHSDSGDRDLEESTRGFPAVDTVLSRPVPAALASELAAVTDGGPVGTYGDWLEVMADALGRAPMGSDLCRAADARHEATVAGETERFVCVLDPLVLPWLLDDTVSVRSTCPETGRPVRSEVDAAGKLAIEPASAVVSIGASDPSAEGLDDPLDRAYIGVCEYTHAFTDPAAYRRWADATDAATGHLTYGARAALARAIARRLGG